jgi:uncharacterized protein YkwD
MKIIRINFALLLFISILFISCSQEDDGVYFEKISETKSVYSDLELEIIDLINNYRVSKGLPTFIKLDIISSIALTHTDYVVETNELNHDNFPQRHEYVILNTGAKLVGLNVDYGYSSAKGVVNAWIKSDGHKAIIENESYTYFGISSEQNSKEKTSSLRYL